MDENELIASIEVYKSQLEQVETALSVTPPGSSHDELSQLKGDLQQVLDLTQDSLLSLRKSQMLGALETSSSAHLATSADTSNAEQHNISDMDREFLAFQAAISEETGENSSHNSTQQSGESSTSLSNSLSNCESNAQSNSRNDCVEPADVSCAALDEIAGTKCRVPYRREWGPVSWHNAMIVCAEDLQEDTEPAVRVLFCNPSEQAMLPCPYYLEGKCKFDSEKCRYSHGFRIDVSDLHEFEEPDYSLLKMSCRCRAKYYGDDLWYEGKIVDILDDDEYKVMFDSYDNTETVRMEDILPLGGDEDGSDDDIHDDRSCSPADLRVSRSDSEEDEDEAPVFLWRPAKTTDALGQWEKHTKGIGSRLMCKMGYIIGQGLGKNGEGRAEPVPIQLLPSGKSLDKIMELKEKAGDRDLYDVMKKSKQRQKKIDNQAEAGYKKPKPKSVFDIINKKLGGKKGNLHTLTKSVGGKKSEQHHIGERDLKERSDKHLNVQLFKTHEELRNVDRQLKSLNESLTRNAGNKSVTTKIQQKIASMQTYKNQLTSSADSIEKHKVTRKDQKKMSIF